MDKEKVDLTPYVNKLEALLGVELIPKLKKLSEMLVVPAPQTTSTPNEGGLLGMFETTSVTPQVAPNEDSLLGMFGTTSVTPQVAPNEDSLLGMFGTAPVTPTQQVSPSDGNLLGMFGTAPVTPTQPVTPQVATPVAPSLQSAFGIQTGSNLSVDEGFDCGEFYEYDDGEVEKPSLTTLFGATPVTPTPPVDNGLQSLFDSITPVPQESVTPVADENATLTSLFGSEVVNQPTPNLFTGLGNVQEFLGNLSKEANLEHINFDDIIKASAPSATPELIALVKQFMVK